MAPLSEPERREFWEICEDRYQVHSTILTSQLQARGGTNRLAIQRWPMASSTPQYRDARRLDAQEAWEAELIAVRAGNKMCFRELAATEERFV